MISRLDEHSRILLAMVLVAVVGRVLAALWLGDSLYFDDEAVYLDAARALLDTGGFGEDFRREPVYPIFLALMAIPFGDGILALRLGQAIVVGLGCGVLFLLGRSLFGPTVAMFAVLIYTLDPLLTISGSLLYSEALAAVVLMTSLLLMRSAISADSLWLSAWSGLTLGLLAQIRQISIVLVGVAAIWLWFRLAAGPMRRLQHLVLILLVVSTALTPWMIRNYRIYDHLVPVAPSGFSSTTQLTHDQAIEEGFGKTYLGWIVGNPGSFTAELVANFARFWEPFPTRLWTDDVGKTARLHESDPRLPDRPKLPARSRDVVSAVSFGVEMILAIVGFAVGWRKRRPEIVFLGTVILAFALAYAVFEGRIRYRIPIMPELFLLSAIGMTTLLSRYQPIARRLPPMDTGANERSDRGTSRPAL